LIAAAAVREFTTRNLARVSQKDLEQATSDQQTAEGNLRAARDAVVSSAKPMPISIALSPNEWPTRPW
jgi:hypothetical protein